MHSTRPHLRILYTLAFTRSYHHHSPCLTHKLEGYALMPPWDLASSTLDNTSDLTILDSLISILHHCRGKADIVYAKLLHTHICSYGLESHSAVGNHMVSMFVACENVVDAQQVFDKLDHQSSHSWSSLISGYIQCGQVQDAISLYQKVQEDGSSLLLALLKSCTRLKDVKRCQGMHINIIQKGFEQDLYIGNTLIDMYAKCGLNLEAHSVFNKLRDRNVVSWNALMAGYADSHKAIHCFHQMQIEGVSADSVTFTCMLKACHSVGAMEMGREIHRDIVSNGLEQDLFVGSSLVSMYANCGLLAEAWEVFNKLHVRDAVSWTALLAGCAEHGAGRETLKHFEQMRHEGISPTAYLYACSFKACGSIAMAERGREIHMEVVHKGFEEDVYVGSSLIDMYAKCSLLSEAWEVFNKMPIRNVVSWNALIAGYADHAPGRNALKCHEQMHREHVSPNVVTLSCILKSCASIGAIGKGQEVHIEVMHKGLEKDLLVGTTLVDMYANFGSLLEAQEVFGKMAVRNVVSWNVLMAGYAEHGPSQQALTCFEEMKLQGVSPSAITYTCVLEACGKMGALEKGHEMHAEIIKKGFEIDYFVGNVLVNLYAKWGSLTDAQEIFDKLPARSFESWTALLTGYAEHEWSSEALRCFEQMKLEGVFLDAIGFVCVLKACGCIGAIEKGQEVYQEILKRGFEGDPFVGITLVDVYCKCNSLSEAHKVFHMLSDRNAVAWNALIGGYAKHGLTQVALKCYDEMQLHFPSKETWTVLLSACKTYAEVELGQRCFQQLVWLDQESAVPYTLMASIYATAGRWDDVKRVEELKKLAGAAKKPASCFIEANKVHEAVVYFPNIVGTALPLEVISSFSGNMGQP